MLSFWLFNWQNWASGPRNKMCWTGLNVLCSWCLWCSEERAWLQQQQLLMWVSEKAANTELYILAASRKQAEGGTLPQHSRIVWPARQLVASHSPTWAFLQPEVRAAAAPVSQSQYSVTGRRLKYSSIVIFTLWPTVGGRAPAQGQRGHLTDLAASGCLSVFDRTTSAAPSGGWRAETSALI